MPNNLTTQSVDETVKLDASDEIDLRSFIEYIAERTKTRFTYDPAVVQKKIHIIAPDPIPVRSLHDVLQSVLKTEGLVLADAGVPGWMRIVSTERISEVARPFDDRRSLDEAGAAEAVTRIFAIKSADPAALTELLRPTLSRTGAAIIAVPNQRLLIITDVAENIRRISQLIDLLDNDKPLAEVRFIAVENVKADEIAEQLKKLLQARSKALGRKEDQGSGVEVVVESRTNQLIMIGNSAEVIEAETILKRLDRQLPTTAVTIPLTNVSPERFDEILRQMIEGRPARPPYQSHVERNTVVIESTPEVIALAQRVRNELDTPQAPADQSPIRFYKIKNVPASELLDTVQSVFSSKASPSRRTLPDRRRTTNDAKVPGPNNPPVSPNIATGPYGPSPVTPALRQDFQTPNNSASSMAPAFSADANSLNVPLQQNSNQNLTSELIGEASVTVDVHTNTIIVVAKPEVQRIYATLIEQLDKRRPQVLVEAKVVIIDTSDDFSLGVEVSGGDRTGAKKLFAFSSYGFSQVAPTTGALQIVPGVGFNGTLVDPSTADVVVRALSAHRRARVLSSPRILVNDNAEGELTSVLEVPFTSVNASQTVATTSFAGFAQAGTTITVTPTISEDNYLQMDYVVTLNSFTGDGAQGVPPPRQTNEVRSRVTVPDGYTVIVGGLTNKNDSSQYRGLPWLEKIPIVREVTGATTSSWKQTSLFVFLRPVILRDDKFKDLKYVSDFEVKEAKVPGEYPVSDTLSIR